MDRLRRIVDDHDFARVGRHSFGQRRAHVGRTGTFEDLEVEVIPPADSDYVDEQANNEIVVADG